MLIGSARFSLALATVLALGILVSACGGSSEETPEVAATSTASVSTPGQAIAATPRVGGPNAPGSPPEVLGFDSLRSMVEWRPTVLVGQVLEGAKPFYKDPDQPCTIPFLVTPIKVLQLIHSDDPALGNEISFVQQAGPEAEEGCIVVSGGGEPPLEPGQRFLFFLSDLRGSGFPGYGAFWAARFEVGDDGSVVPNGAEVYYAGPRQVSGVTAEQVRDALSSADPNAALKTVAHVTVAEAADQILAAIAEGPLPTPLGEQPPDARTD